MSLIKDLLDAYHEDESCICWLKVKIKALKNANGQKLQKDLERYYKSRAETRKMLDQYYIHGITPEQLHKDIQR